LSGEEGHELSAIELIRDWRTHASLACGDFEKLLAFVGTVGHESSVGNNLKHEIARSRECSAADGSATRGTPPCLLCHGVPSKEEAAANVAACFRPDNRWLRLRRRTWTTTAANGGLAPADTLEFSFAPLKDELVLLRI
jgi:hypothetical protein